MSVTLAVACSGERSERLAAELLVAPFFASERPLRGAAGRVDWRLCGLLTEQILGGGLTGASSEATLVPSGGRLKAPRVLLLGLGSRQGGFGDGLFHGASLLGWDLRIGSSEARARGPDPVARGGVAGRLDAISRFMEDVA